SVFYQPVLVFYRAPRPISRLSELQGKRISIGRPGSGTRVLAETLLKANGIEPGGATPLLDFEGKAAADALVQNRADAVFLMGDAANRYYQWGKSFAYKPLPCWLASLVDRALVMLVPIIVVLIPGLRIVPWLYRWRVNARIYRRYAELMALERVAFGQTTPEQRAGLLKRLDEIERRTVTGKLPASVAEQLYVLRQHIHFVRSRIQGTDAETAAGAAPPSFSKSARAKPT